AGSMAPPAMLSSRPPDPLPRAAARLHESARPVPRDEDDDADGRTEAGGGDDASYEDVGDGDFEPEEQPLELSRRNRHPSPDGDVLVESSIEVVEEVGEPQSTATSEQATRILADAAAFRRAHFHAKAIETLRIGLEVAPRSVEVHEMLRDVLTETGQVDDAVHVMLALAGLQVDGLDGESAARTLQDLLAIDPQNERATEMLRELGYELVEEPVPPSESARLPPMRPEYQSTSSYDPEAPLPSYDLEEIGPEDVALRSYSEPSMRTAPAVGAMARSNIEDIDDPFGAEAPLPSFPLDPPPESEAAFELVGGRLDATDAYASQPDHEEIQDAVAVPRAPELESALEEAEFFATRGLYDDARTILEEQLARLPNHPLLVERLAELDVQERGTPGGSGTRPSPAAAASVEDRAFDIAASLGALDGGDRVSNVGPPGLRRANEQVDVEEVFAKFKEGVAKQIDVDDAQSHYDLGVAYKEMALIDDAIREFETAARDPKRTCICQSMIGTIQLERGNLNEAIDAFIRGLQAPDRTREQEASLCYEIGAAYEVKRMSKQALEHFQRAARLVPTFRDVQERIRRLSKGEPKQPVRAVAVGADDEFDRAFDDILGSGKLP
ncbi:MAG TPA: tetratricopeptide repeat protein, partial [Polyangiaceae bacterium]|nr:tetratricopeptide repeat protein [Polyangiaceae bacterium]